MATYIQISPNGHRQEVKYNPHHYGPVSHRLTLLKKVKYLAYQLNLKPGTPFLAKKLRRAQHKLAVFDSWQQKVSSKKSHEVQNLASRHEHRHSSQDQPHRDKSHKRDGWHRNRSASDSAIGLGLQSSTQVGIGQSSIPPLEALFGYQYPLEPISIGLV